MSLTDPSHPGLSVRDSMEAMGWTVTGCAVQLGVSRNTMSRLINGRCGISPAMALALERIGWSNAEFWMRRQAQYDLAQERRRSVAV
jgi:addiction module HigA family antidote